MYNQSKIEELLIKVANLRSLLYVSNAKDITIVDFDSDTEYKLSDLIEDLSETAEQIELN